MTFSLPSLVVINWMNWLIQVPFSFHSLIADQWSTVPGRSFLSAPCLPPKCHRAGKKTSCSSSSVRRSAPTCSTTSTRVITYPKTRDVSLLVTFSTPQNIARDMVCFIKTSSPNTPSLICPKWRQSGLNRWPTSKRSKYTRSTQCYILRQKQSKVTISNFYRYSSDCTWSTGWF